MGNDEVCYNNKMYLIAFILAQLSAVSLAWDWIDGGDGDLKGCYKSTSVLGVYVCTSKKAFDQKKALCDHVVHVLAQLLDEDEDGVADDKAVHDIMANSGKKWIMLVPKDENDLERYFDDVHFDNSQTQLTMTREAAINSCDVPSNRGAHDTDRSTWAAAKGNSPGSTGCDPARDATVEEVLHLITEAARRAYPDLWGANYESQSGKALKALNGNCGWGYTGNWKDPAGSSCTGHYAYNDTTCKKMCIVVEGIYWASVSYIGGLFTDAHADFASSEWLLTVPDSSMASALPNYSNAKTLQDASPELYALVADTTSAGHAWLPSKFPDGNYGGSQTDTSGGDNSGDDAGDKSGDDKEEEAGDDEQDKGGDDKEEEDGDDDRDNAGDDDRDEAGGDAESDCTENLNNYTPKISWLN